MTNFFKILFYGFLVWLIPMLVSFIFYSSLGTLLIDAFLFKSILIIVSSFTAAYFLVSYFKRISVGYIKEGFIIGFAWLGLHLLLDLIIATPLSITSVEDYIYQIGLRYFVIPGMSIAVGVALSNDNKKRLKVFEDRTDLSD